MDGEHPPPPFAHDATGGASPLRASIFGGLLGAIGVVLLLMAVGVISVKNATRKASSVRGADQNAKVSAPLPSPSPVATAASAPAPLPAPAPLAPTSEPMVMTDTVAAAPPPDAAEERVDRYRDALESAVLRADQVEIDALKSLDPGPAYDAYTGAQLQQLMGRVESLRSQNTYIVESLVNLEWVRFAVSPDEGSADVEVRETWTTEYRRNGPDECLSRIPEHVFPQTAHLRYTDGIWKVESITFHTSSPQPEAC
jgi:hypothetical protein